MSRTTTGTTTTTTTAALANGHPIRSRSTMGDQRLTTCSRCGRSIYESQPHEWSRDPLGLCHIDCNA